MIAIYDPIPHGNAYATFFLNALRAYTTIGTVHELSEARNCTLLLLSDYLKPEVILMLKNNGCKIVGFNVTDSSYISQVCRYASELPLVDLMFMVSGIQRTNDGHEIELDPDCSVRLQPRQFLEPEYWAVFDKMREDGKLHSLPYIHWDKQPGITPQPYRLRSQKAFIRGGGHMRRIILALKLMSRDLLDVNSGFMLRPYFSDDMNPQFRFCDGCRARYKRDGRFVFSMETSTSECNSPAPWKTENPFDNLSMWNNRCPESWANLAIRFKQGANMRIWEHMLNASWLSAEQHLGMLSRITMTSDLKWIFSIYAPQRFWDGAMAGAINVLPSRTKDQDYFPEMSPGQHYLTFKEDMQSLEQDFHIEETGHERISEQARRLYEKWIRATDYPINTNLLHHMMERINAL